jgi:predicted nucleic acid-binding protein
MIELMSKYEISLFDDSMSLEEFQSEINQARMGLKTNNFSRGLPIVGLVGVIILAKEQGLIDSVKSILDDLIIKGTRISPKIYNYALITAGEV